MRSTPPDLLVKPDTQREPRLGQNAVNTDQFVARPMESPLRPDFHDALLECSEAEVFCHEFGPTPVQQCCERQDIASCAGNVRPGCSCVKKWTTGLNLRLQELRIYFFGPLV